MAARRKILITPTPFDVSEELRALASPDHAIGGVASFTGHVRGAVKDRPLQRMSLEHYPGMTEAELMRIVDEAESRWPIAAVSIIHRVGDLAPGDLIVLVSVGSAHRQAALDGAAFIMDFLKTRAPFWKREVFSDGSSTWVDARETDHMAAQRWLQKSDA